MNSSPLSDDLSRRERQVLEIVIRLGRATARDIEAELSDAPTYSAVRSILRILGAKGWIIKTQETGRDWYAPAQPASKAKAGALRSMVNRLFSDSVCDAACALLGDKKVKLSAEEAQRLIKLINEATRK
ncbi:MAG: CopY family transcriptional regulator [Rariglobus sp.]|jgi:predicted transcriptional regulator|nr:CopY family transcriptional regulator [Rariglobus sp.]